MNRNRFAFSSLLVLALFLSACHGLPLPGGGGGGTGGSTGTATVSFTLIADTPALTPPLLSFKVSIIGVTLTPTTGTAVTLQPASPIVVDLLRLQSDTAFLGSLASVPTGTYTAQVSVSSPEVTFVNSTTAAITVGSTSCAVHAVCTASLSATGNPSVSSFTFTATASGKQGIELVFNMGNAVSLTGGVLTVNFNPSGTPVFTAFPLPRTNSNLASGQLELIEDFTGVVSVSGTTVTVTSPVRGALAATSTSGSFFDLSPDGSLCPSPGSFAKCVVNGQIASVDVLLNSDGTLSLKEFEPLVATQKDFVEGTVLAVNTPTQFVIIVTDKIQAASNSLIASLNTGDPLTVNLSPTVTPFFVDTKGLPVATVAPTTFGQFFGQVSTTALHAGQSVAVDVASFTIASGSTFASSVTDTATLRWSRLTATPVAPLSSSIFNITNFPPVFSLSLTGTAGVQVFPGTPGTPGVTNFDGVTDPTGLNTSKPVAIRALFLDDPSQTIGTPFFAAKVRQH